MTASLEEKSSKRNRELENFANFGSRICEDLVYSEWPYLIPGALKLGQRGTLLFYNYYQSSDDLTAKPICQNKDQVKYRLARCIPCLIRLLNNCMCTVWMVKVMLES